jgi:hypothetical protein
MPNSFEYLEGERFRRLALFTLDYFKDLTDLEEKDYMFSGMDIGSEFSSFKAQNLDLKFKNFWAKSNLSYQKIGISGTHTQHSLKINEYNDSDQTHQPKTGILLEIST